MKVTNNFQSLMNFQGVNALLVIFISLVLFGCEKSKLDYFPLESGYRWEYLITEKLNDETKIGKSIVSNLQSKKVNNVTYYPRWNANGETHYFSKSEEGIFLSPSVDQTGEIIFKYPLELGTNWKAATRIDILDSRHESFSGGESFISLDEEIVLKFKIAGKDDKVQTSIGVFTNCLRIEGTASVTVKERTRGIDLILIQQTDWYAPGAGLVKRIRKEQSVPDKYIGEQLIELVKLNRS